MSCTQSSSSVSLLSPLEHDDPVWIWRCFQHQQKERRASGSLLSCTVDGRHVLKHEQGGRILSVAVPAYASGEAVVAISKLGKRQGLATPLAMPCVAVTSTDGHNRLQRLAVDGLWTTSGLWWCPDAEG